MHESNEDSEEICTAVFNYIGSIVCWRTFKFSASFAGTGQHLWTGNYASLSYDRADSAGCCF